MKTIGAGAFFGEALTGDRERGTCRAEGGPFLVPFMIESRFGLAGIGGVVLIGGVGLLTIEYLFIEEFGTLKFGVRPGERLRLTLGGPPYVECRCSLAVGCGSGTGTCMVCMDRLRSLTAAALGPRCVSLSSMEDLGSMSSKLALSRVGDEAGEEP